MWPKDQEWRAPALGDFPPPWASAWGDDRYGLWADLVVAEVVQRMRWIEPSGPEGFLMGSKKKEERDKIKDKNVSDWANQSETEPTVQIVPKGYWLADTPCTQAFWQAVMGANPSHFHEGSEASSRPVEQVNVEDCEQFLKAVQAQLPVRISAALPTEVEWEYACRAGTQGSYWWGDTYDSTKANAGGFHNSTTPVKAHEPNPWGLYDMHGNVWEWTRSVWSQRIDKPSQDEFSVWRVVRGGSWIDDPANARSAYRFGWPPDWRYSNQGLRFVLRS